MSADHRCETPIGILVNNSVFEKDQYVDEKGRKADPSYKLELALDDDDALAEMEENIIQCAVDEWGEQAREDYAEGEIISPIKNGDEYADEREKRGKNGDVYRGKVYIRAHTIFNQHGEDGPGGIYVCDENAEEIDFAMRHKKVYNGCLGCAIVTPSAYSINGERGVSLYLGGFQVTGEGKRLGGNVAAGLFKPQVTEASETKGRKARGRGK